MGEYVIFNILLQGMGGYMSISFFFLMGWVERKWVRIFYWEGWVKRE